MEEFERIIADELSYFEQKYNAQLVSENPLLNKILLYLSERKGKRIRPILVLLCARLSGPINERSIRATLFVELLHTSTLLHDDIVDHSFERRGSFSVNALWKNKAALQTGIYLYNFSVLQLLLNKD